MRLRRAGGSRSACGSPALKPVKTDVPTTPSPAPDFALQDTSAVPTDKDTETYQLAMKTYEPSANTGSFAPSGFESIIDFYRAMMTASDPASLNAASVATTLQSAKNIPLFMGGGQTFSCGQLFFTGEPSVCTGAAFLVSDTGGTFSLVGSYNASQLLKGI